MRINLIIHLPTKDAPRVLPITVDGYCVELGNPASPEECEILIDCFESILSVLRSPHTNNSVIPQRTAPFEPNVLSL